MAKEHETSAQPWGTLEELLLACAVSRHGTKSWESIAMELQNRSSSVAPSFLTPQNCRDKFHDLKRRFMSKNDDQPTSLVDELRRIRVEELRREVRRRDVSILSLELKVKRLEEERVRSLKEAELQVDLKKNPDGADGGVRQPPPAEKSSSDTDDRENRSFNESNSTSQKVEEAKQNQNGVVIEKAKAEREPEQNESDPVRIRCKPERDWSVNGKVIDENGNETETETVVREAEEPRWAGESNEAWESVGESKREGKELLGAGVASKQSSDVQSSASLSRKKRRRKGQGDGVAPGGASSGEEPEGDEVSPATKRVSTVKSEPLVKFLGIIRSHRLGSVFERRLRSQESGRYKNLIRQHMDLQAVQARLDKGVYSDCIHKFFRDLLLLFNNAIVFFRKTSPEHIAAQELRVQVLKEMNHKKLGKPQPTTLKMAPKQVVDSFAKSNKSSIIIECRKRSSNKALSEGTNKRRDVKKEREVEEKPKANEKKIDASLAKMEDKGVRKKRTQERVGAGRRSSSKSTSTKGGRETRHEYGGNELSSHDALEVKVEKKENAKKKQGVESFLKRMKQNSPKNQVEEENDDDDDDDIVSEEESKDSKMEKEKKRRGRKRSEGRREERVTRSSSGGRGSGVRDEIGKAKRGVGRPPKRQDSVAAASGRRGRESNGDSEVGNGGRSRKRLRR